MQELIRFKIQNDTDFWAGCQRDLGENMECLNEYNGFQFFLNRTILWPAVISDLRRDIRLLRFLSAFLTLSCLCLKRLGSAYKEIRFHF